MNKRTVIFIACILVFSLLIGGSFALARDGSARIDVMYRNIKLVVNGVSVPVSADNEPFIYGGRTYVPLRVVSDALGYDVSWDANTSSVIIGDAVASAPPPAPMPTPTPTPEPTPSPVTGEQKLIDVLPPYHVSSTSQVKHYPTTDIGSISMGGTEYKNSLSIDVTGASPNSASFNLGGNYTSLAGIVGTMFRSNYSSVEAIVNVYADGQVIRTFELQVPSLPQNFSIDVTGVRELKIELAGTGRGAAIGMAELIIK